MNKASFDSFLISALKKHYWIALTTFISVVGASAVYLAFAPSRYKTSAKLIVGEQEISIFNLGRQLVDKSIKTPGRIADPVASQAELVTTKRVLQRALKNFQLNTEISKPELPLIRDFKKEIDVEIVPATNVLKLIYHDSDPKVAADLLNSVAESVVEENLEGQRLQASALRTFLEAKIIEQQAKLQQAEAAESKYRQAQGQINFEEQTKSLVSSLSELENEERMLQAQLQATNIEDDLLKQTTGIDNFDQASQAIRLGQDEEVQQLQNQLKELEETISNRRSYLTDQAPELQALVEERDRLRASYEQKLAASFPAEHTSSSNNLTSNPDNLDLISQYISGQIENKALESRLKTVQVELKNLRNRVAQTPANQKPLAELVRKKEQAEASLKLMQSKLEEAEIAETRPTNTTRILDSASVNTIPVFPKPAAVLLISSTAGILLALVIVSSLEILKLEDLENSSYSYINSKENLPLPVLGVMPELTPTKSNSYLDEFLDNSALVEPYRALLKKLESSARDKISHINQSGKIIVVSSIVSEDDKLSTILHLSSVAAMLSRRTLIIDADLSRPMQHKFLGVPASPGLTEVLTNSLSFLSAVQSTTIKNLSVLTSGQFHSRPAALIESESMNILLEKAAEYYDLVIVNAPAVSISADATALSQITDGLVMVVHPNTTSKKEILEVISKVENSNATTLGIIIDEATNIPKKILGQNGTKNRRLKEFQEINNSKIC